MHGGRRSMQVVYLKGCRRSKLRIWIGGIRLFDGGHSCVYRIGLLEVISHYVKSNTSDDPLQGLTSLVVSYHGRTM